MNFLIVNQYIHLTGRLFFLNPTNIYVKNQTIVQPFYNFIIYMIYLLSSDKNLITIKRKVKNGNFEDYFHTFSYQTTV